jgi:hypothetical protein
MAENTDKIMMQVVDQAEYLDGPEYGNLDELPEEERKKLLDEFARRDAEA